VRSNDTSNCPVCKAPLCMRSWRKRVMIASSGEKIELQIRRLKCPKCERIHHELPDCLVPYKRHCAEIIEEIIDARTPNIPCEKLTIHRILQWWSIVMPYFLDIFYFLSEKHTTTPPLFKEIVYTAVNANKWIFASLNCTRSAYAR
jgi:hypothetical protein